MRDLDAARESARRDGDMMEVRRAEKDASRN